MSRSTKKSPPVRKAPAASFSNQPIPRAQPLLSETHVGFPGQNLGTILREFNQSERFEWKRKWSRWIALASGSVFVLGLILGVYGISYFGQAAAMAWSLPAIYLAGILLAIWLITAWPTRQRKVLVHQHGLSLWESHQKGHSFRWSEISGIRYLQDEWVFLGWKINMNKSVLFPNWGKPIELGKYCLRKDLPELVTRIKANVYNYLEPQYRKSLWEKRALYFGDVIISPEYLSIRGHQYAWEEVKRLDIKVGILVIYHYNQVISYIPLDRIQNVELILPMAQLAKEIGLIQSRHTQ